jgi:hypothetical protein
LKGSTDGEDNTAKYNTLPPSQSFAKHEAEYRTKETALLNVSDLHFARCPGASQSHTSQHYHCQHELQQMASIKTYTVPWRDELPLPEEVVSISGNFWVNAAPVRSPLITP